MKKLLLVATFLVAAQVTTYAQAFTAAAGYSARPVFNTQEGFTIAGLGTDSSGNLYYLQTGPYGGGPADTRLFKRTAATNFATPIELFSYGTAVSANFVRVADSTVYFGEGVGSSGTVRRVGVDGTNPSLLLNLSGNYDMAVGSSGAFISAALNGDPVNKVYKIDLATGVLDTIVSPTNDYSGPIAVTASGALLYGATLIEFGGQTLGAGGGIYSYSAGDIASVTDANPGTNDRSLALTSRPKVINNGNNQYLAYVDDQRLYQGTSPFTSAATLRRFSLSGSIDEAVGETASTDFLGSLAVSGSSLYAVVTASFADGPSAVYEIIPVPEPHGLWLATLGSVSLWSFRRIRARSPRG